MKYIHTHYWFTLIEVIVSITIFSIMMVSVMSIFLFASQMSTRVEINRVMQENLKRVIEDIAENMRIEWLTGVRDFEGSCKKPDTSNTIVSAIWLCTWSKKYTLGYKEENGGFSVVSNIAEQCWGLEDICYILKKSESWDYFPLSNSFIHFENIEFTISNIDTSKLTIQITARPAIRKGLSSEIVKNNYIYIQTTLSQRLIKTY